MRNSTFRIPLVLTAIVLALGTSGRFSAQTTSDIPRSASDPISKCAVELVRDESGPTQNGFSSNYKILNGGDRGIKTIVILGISGTSRVEIYPGDYLRPGEELVHNVSGTGRKGVDPESKAFLDLVLFSDGTTCGPDIAERSHYVTGLFAGENEAIRDIGSLIRTDLDAPTMSAWVNASLKEDLPNGIDRSKNLEWSKGYLSGYRHIVRTITMNLETDGVEGVKWRIRMFEATLGNADTRKSLLKE